MVTAHKYLTGMRPRNNRRLRSFSTPNRPERIRVIFHPVYLELTVLTPRALQGPTGYSAFGWTFPQFLP